MNATMKRAEPVQMPSPLTPHEGRASPTAAGITAKGWGMGVVVGDIDNDGWEDIFISG